MRTIWRRLWRAWKECRVWRVDDAELAASTLEELRVFQFPDCLVTGTEPTRHYYTNFHIERWRYPWTPDDLADRYKRKTANGRPIKTRRGTCQMHK